MEKEKVMHFRAEMTVLLNQPLPIENSSEDGEAIGYVIVLGVNAPDLASAVRYAHDAALRPKQPDGSFRSFDGVVVEAQVQRIEKDDWEPIIRKNAKRIDQEGVYYSTGLAFFGAGEAEDGNDSE
jgi:hypothetical protein